MEPIPPTLPFHLASAYGVPLRVRPVAPVSPVQRVQGDIRAESDPRTARLVAGVVPGAVDFSGDAPRPAAALPLYRHPADRNAAATGVSLGRLLDTNA